MLLKQRMYIAYAFYFLVNYTSYIIKFLQLFSLDKILFISSGVKVLKKPFTNLK